MAYDNQHTIPQFYLGRFLTPGFVYRRGETGPRSTSNPKNVAASSGYYGNADEFNTIIETEGAPVLKQLIDDMALKNADDWQVLSYLFANFAVRTPAVVESIQASILDLAAQADEMAKRMGEKLQEALEAGSDLSEFPTSDLANSEPSMTIEESNEYANRLGMPGGHRLGLLFDAIPEIADGMQKMRFIMFVAPEGNQFLTSDRLLVLRSWNTNSAVGAGWLLPDAMGTIALSPSHYLYMIYEESPGITEVNATPEQVAALNVDTINLARQEVYSQTENAEAYDWMIGAGRWT